MYFIEHPTIIFLFFTIPFFSWGLCKWSNYKIILYTLYSSLVLLLPIVSGYTYILDNAYTLLIYIALCCGYSLFLNRVKNKPSTVIKHSIILFIIFGVISFYGGFFGTVAIEHEWEVKNHKVQYLREQGFSGGPLFKYELYEYGHIPIFIKHVETKIDSDTTNSCVVKFEYKDFRFNKCSVPEN